MGEIRRIEGVFVALDDARTIAQALTLYRNDMPRLGQRPTAKFEEVRQRLASAVRASNPDVPERDSAGSADPVAWFGHEFIDTTTAATLLGCSAANVRDLARRGSLPAVLVGGRWLVAVDAVRARAA